MRLQKGGIGKVTIDLSVPSKMGVYILVPPLRLAPALPGSE